MSTNPIDDTFVDEEENPFGLEDTNGTLIFPEWDDPKEWNLDEVYFLKLAACTVCGKAVSNIELGLSEEFCEHLVALWEIERNWGLCAWKLDNPGEGGELDALMLILRDGGLTLSGLVELEHSALIISEYREDIAADMHSAGNATVMDYITTVELPRADAVESRVLGLVKRLVDEWSAASELAYEFASAHSGDPLSSAFSDAVLGGSMALFSLYSSVAGNSFQLEDDYMAVWNSLKEGERIAQVVRASWDSLLSFVVSLHNLGENSSKLQGFVDDVRSMDAAKADAESNATTAKGRTDKIVWSEDADGYRSLFLSLAAAKRAAEVHGIEMDWDEDEDLVDLVGLHDTSCGGSGREGEFEGEQE